MIHIFLINGDETNFRTDNGDMFAGVGGPGISTVVGDINDSVSVAGVEREDVIYGDDIVAGVEIPGIGNVISNGGLISVAGVRVLGGKVGSSPYISFCLFFFFFFFHGTGNVFVTFMLSFCEALQPFLRELRISPLLPSVHTST
jgi:hypothetical protein